MPATISLSGRQVDLSQRIGLGGPVVASPAAAAETIICQGSIPSDLTLTTGVLVFGWCAFTMGTSGTAYTLRIRQTSVGGTLVASAGAVTATAANLVAPSMFVLDSSPPAGGLYVMTLQITAGAAVSTVSAVQLILFAT